ncbi:pseudouridine synthase [uncultured Alistipes sp.]|uniref:pseudouridine synthase n=1 Tax=uncultured Alistipes sp. TaxID=538949 RepID=UPI0026330DD9|nr:pseudouridine synthase [uncultured Alistipes sp.]
MKTFDPKNHRKRTFEGRDRRDERFGNSSNRDDSGRSGHHDDSASFFVRDKRPRIGRTVRDNDSANRPAHTDGERRRSFNPNFTQDNRMKGEAFREKPFEKKGYGQRYAAAPKSDRPYRRDDRDDRFRHREDGPSGYRPRTGNAARHTEDTESRGGFARGNDRYGQSDRRHDDRNGKKPGRKGTPPHKTGPGNYPRYEAKQTGEIRLNRFIANSGICSRREADDLITAGLVAVNGTIVTELGSKVRPEDEVRFNGSVIKGEKKVYILMNKPKGFVTSLDDPHADKTVMDLVKGACTERVYPVGRLDKNSVGVLLITNDGELTRKLTHPSYNKQKVYQVTLDKALTQADMTKIAEGITLEDGPIHADEISYVGENRREVGIEIHSGRNRIVRRIFESLGYSVQKLDRVYFAGLTKKRLKRGAWRFLTPQEVTMLKSGEYE